MLARSSVWEKPGPALTIMQCDEHYNSTMYGSRGEGINSGARIQEKHKEELTWDSSFEG